MKCVVALAFLVTTHLVMLTVQCRTKNNLDESPVCEKVLLRRVHGDAGCSHPGK